MSTHNNGRPHRNRRRGRRPARRSLARLNAVQALYQLEQNRDSDPHGVVEEFRTHRLGRDPGAREDETPDSAMVDVDADVAFFVDLVEGASGRRQEIDAWIVRVLPADWPLERLESVVRAILRAGTYELMARPDVPTATVIDEYLNVAHAFFDGGEAPFINGVLDRLGRELRGGGSDDDGTTRTRDERSG